VFVHFSNVANARNLLAWLQPRVANAYEVKGFNDIFREIRQRTDGEEPLKATWIAAMISAAGLNALGQELTDLPAGDSGTAFTAGMAGRAAQIGDTGSADAPAGWKEPFRPGSPNQVHLAIVIASDDECDLDHRLVELYEQVTKFGCEVVYNERGATLPPPLTGHEHFGFKDGISQPAVEGFDPPPSDPLEPPVVAAGEFILGVPDAAGTTNGTGTIWENGSYVVFRRLVQNVAAFRTLAQTPTPGANPPVGADQLGAMLVGRWPSGAPLELNPTSDPGPGNESNAFQFKASDDSGAICPVWAHVRKTNPRDETTPDPPGDDPARHRMIRRGIPFGLPLPAGAADDGRERGLHFFCVVADIVRQFEFIQSRWMNDPNFPQGAPPSQSAGPYGPPTSGTPAGPDPLVGEHDTAAQCVLHQAGGDHPFPLGEQLVHVTAGEYFFLPSVASIGQLAATSAPPASS
jgi:Dyp-type peroxidase family